MKVLRVIFRCLVGLLLSVCIVLMIIQSLPGAQQKMAGIVKDVLAQTLGTQVEVGKVDISAFGCYAQIDSLCIKDRLGYPMLSASRVSANFSFMQLLRHSIYLEHVHVYGFSAALRQERADSAWNFQFFIDALKSDGNKDNGAWPLTIKSIRVREGEVAVDQVYKPVAQQGFDPAHIILHNIKVNATINKIVGDTIDVGVSRLALSEQSGLHITGMDANFIKHGECMRLEQCVCRMPHSVADVTAQWDDGQWMVQTNKVYLDCEDLAFVDERLRDKGAVRVKLLASGDKSRCTVDTLELQHDALSVVTDAEVCFSPLRVSTRNTKMHIAVPALADVLQQRAALPQFCHNNYNLDFEGNVLYDERRSALEGTILSPNGTLQLRADVADNDRFALSVSTKDLDLRQLHPDIQVIAMDANASGSIKKRQFEISDSIYYMMIGGYAYHNIYLAAAMDDSVRLNLSLEDIHLKGNVQARANISDRVLSLDANITRLRPDALDGKWNYDNTSYSGRLVADVAIPQDVTKTTGFVALRDIRRDGVTLSDSLVVTSTCDSVQDIKVRSSFMTADLHTRDLRRLIQHREDSIVQARVRLWDDALLDTLFGVRLSLLDTLCVDVSGDKGPLAAKLLFKSRSGEHELCMDAVAGYYRDSVWLDLSLLSSDDVQSNGRVKAHTALRDSMGLSRIDATVHNLNVGYILDLVNFHSVEFDGWASGDVEVYTRDGSPLINGLLDVHQLTMNDAYMGDLDLLISFDAANGRLGLDGTIVDVPQAHISHAYGYVVPGKRANSGMDLYIDARRINAAFVNHFTRGIFEDIEGRVSGRARVYGKFSQIDLDGDLKVDTLSLRVPMLGTGFQSQGDSVMLRQGAFIFPYMHITDGHGGTAVVDGVLKHQHFNNIEYEFNIDAENLLGYSFDDFGDMPFYATAYATGNVKISGTPGNLDVKIDCTPQKGTVLVYDTSAPTAASADFISYGRLAPDESDVEVILDNVADVTSATNIKLDFNLDITPDARLCVLTDSKAGDGLDLYGRGNINAKYYNKDGFKMYGAFVVDHGEYNLSIQNFLHKQFRFREGGTMTFSGPPLEGILNLQAVYPVHGVSLNDLSSRATFNSSSVNVDCIMNLGGKCEQPRVTFDFDLPNVNDDEKQMVRSLVSTDEERNMQVLYLLGIGRFYSYDYQGNGAGQGNLAMKSLLSSTLSSTLNNVIGNALGTSNWSFGTAIATGDMGWNDMDIEGLISGRLFNNRLLLNGQFGYRDRTTTGSNFIGDFDIQWTLTNSGNIALKAYSETNDRYFTKSSLTTQGVGVVLKKDFNRVNEMFRRNKNKRSNKTKNNKIKR